MNFENTFTVQAPIDEVFGAMMDVERVAPCMPGAEVLERAGEDAYKVGVKVRVGPISMLYRGQVEIVERDAASHRATMQVKARETRGQGTADARVHMSLDEQDGGTRAGLTTELQLSGRAASMGRGVIGDIAAKLIEEFASNLAQMLGAGAGVPAGVGAGAEAATPGTTASAGTLGGSGPPGGTGAPAGASVTTITAPAASQAPPAATPPPAPRGAESLPVGRIAASVIAGRLSNPRTLLVTTIVFAIVFLAIGFAIGRAV